MFKETHPIIGTRDVRRAMAFYTQQLGFKVASARATKKPTPNIGARHRGG
jgi:catechol 2,3-dioxygenase-like lactoylglutathione lyase family enzyme